MARVILESHIQRLNDAIIPIVERLAREAREQESAFGQVDLAEGEMESVMASVARISGAGGAPS